MPISKKRKTSPLEEHESSEPPKRRFAENTTEATDAPNQRDEPESAAPITEGIAESMPEGDATDTTNRDAASKAHERQEKFKALQARSKQSAKHNHKEAAAESQRLATDPNLLSSLSRKQAFASHNLLKADTAASGEDFERKRAWDWTIEESEKWDKRMGKKEKHRDDVAFQDYRQDSRKVYKRQLREMKPDMDGYEKEKMKAVQKAAMSGGLEVLETDDGELVAVDRNGTFYSTADSTDFIENKPERAAVDKLVTDLRKAEEQRLKKRRERGRNEEDGDVTYINDKNKEFNKRLGRFYNKYTAEIRDSFERGTAI
ncbi:MAG: pre-mRNA-splicing factor syf2 [Pycnora praestabilis]|nr:MAG: pre-mRNA-splicing factor syf2 [Pycnora praestabilis]